MTAVATSSPHWECERKEERDRKGEREIRKERRKKENTTPGQRPEAVLLPLSAGPDPSSRSLRLCSPPQLSHLHMHFILGFCTPSGTFFASHLLSYLHCFFPPPTYPRLLIFSVLKNKNLLSSSRHCLAVSILPSSRLRRGLRSGSCPALSSRCALRSPCAPDLPPFWASASPPGKWGQQTFACD